MSSTIPSSELAASLSDLKLDSELRSSGTKATKKPGKKPADEDGVADSWEDDVSGASGSDTETETDAASSEPLAMLARQTTEGPVAPPPTPASLAASSPPFNASYVGIDAQFAGAGAGAAAGPGGPARRPEKTTAVAARLIAGSLGVRAPKRTEEEKEYDRVVREKERKRREKEREEAAGAKEREQEAKKSVWED